MLTKRDRIRGFYSSGWHSKENRIPADSRALFKIAGINKLYIAVAAVKLALDMPADFNPGQRYRCSNTNYLLIAEIIEKVTGEDLYSVLSQEILTPLELSNTYRSIREVDSGRVMSGYHIGWEPDIQSNYFGGMVATAEDVGIFLFVPFCVCKNPGLFYVF